MGTDSNEQEQTVPPFETSGSNDGEIRSAVEREGRIMIASVQLPDHGKVPAERKEAVREMVRAIMKRYGVSYSAIARQIGPNASASTLSEVLRDCYKSEDSRWIRRLNKWCESFVRRQESNNAAGVVRTGVVRAVKTLAEYAQSYGCMTAGFGPAGIGKTISAQALAREDTSTVYVRLRSVHNGPAAFLRTLCEAVGVEARRGASGSAEAIIERLSGSHRLIVVDEWHLAIPSIHEAVRDLHDETGCPFLLLGTSEIYTKLQKTRSRRGEAIADQFFSRVGWVLDLTKLANDGGDDRVLFTIDEIRHIFKNDKVKITPDGLRYLQMIACTAGLGCLRMAFRVFQLAAAAARGRGTSIDRDLLEKAFYEQSVPRGADTSLVERMVEDSDTRIAALAG